MLHRGSGEGVLSGVGRVGVLPGFFWSGGCYLG